MENKKAPMRQKTAIDRITTIVSVSLIFVFVVCMAIWPDATLSVVNVVFDKVTAVVGVPILWFVLIGLFLSLYLAFSRHGKVRLGEGKPTYSMFSYIAMMMCAALASTATYYSFIEWSYYYADPAFGIEAYSEQAAEYAVPYTFFHWGLSVQVVFVLTAVALCYAFYVRKVPVLRIGTVCEEMMKNYKHKKGIAKLVDILTAMSIVGGMGVSLGLGVPLISAGLAKVFGFTASFSTNIIVLVIVAVIFSITSVIGIDKGMKKLSDLTIYLMIFFVAFIFVVGPSGFIMKNITQSVGTMFTHYLDMSLYTDPIRNSGFPEANTIFLFTLALNYAALMGVFITKISKGRTIREMILTCLGGISVGTWLMFGIDGSYGLYQELTGKFALSKAADGQAGVFEMIGSLPGGIIICVVFLVIAVGFLATSLDSASFTLSAVASRQLDENGNPNSKFRLFWCVILALVPLSIMFANAPFSALKTLCICLSVPFLAVIIFMLIGLFRWFKEDGN